MGVTETTTRSRVIPGSGVFVLTETVILNGVIGTE